MFNACSLQGGSSPQTATDSLLASHSMDTCTNTATVEDIDVKNVTNEEHTNTSIRYVAKIEGLLSDGSSLLMNNTLTVGWDHNEVPLEANTGDSQATFSTDSNHLSIGGYMDLATSSATLTSDKFEYSITSHSAYTQDSESEQSLRSVTHGVAHFDNGAWSPVTAEVVFDDKPNEEGEHTDSWLLQDLATEKLPTQVTVDCSFSGVLEVSHALNSKLHAQLLAVVSGMPTRKFLNQGNNDNPIKKKNNQD